MGRGEAGYLTIGFYTSLSAGNLRASLVEYGRRFPQVEISTVEGSRSRLFDRVQNGAVDIAIVTGEPASDCNGSMALWCANIVRPPAWCRNGSNVHKRPQHGADAGFLRPR